MVIKGIVKAKMYQDSVKLMRLSSELNSLEGIVDASVIMATEMNKETLRDVGLLIPEVENATPNDLAIVVRANTEAKAQEAIALAEKLLTSKVVTISQNKQTAPRTIGSAVEGLPGANLALISVPGLYAAGEALKALNLGLNVHIFSDNVSLEDEVMLKQAGTQKELLVMGPDCGTAIINGIPLAFANVVSKGPIGIVGASGTGIQEATILIDRLGSGISHAIGTGGRDLSDAVGGLMMLMGIDCLESDEQTKVILLISKPAGEKTTIKIIERIQKCKKPVIICLMKGKLDAARTGATLAATIEDAVYKAVALASDEEPRPIPENYWGSFSEQATSLRKQLKTQQKYIRGLFTGGTLADEAMVVMRSLIGDVYSNIPLNPDFGLENSRFSKKHTIVDLGDDEFTQGKPHPMIDPTPRNERFIQEYADPEVAVLLCDVVTGYGSHANPASELVQALKKARTLYPMNNPVVVAFVCGTPSDPQPLNEQTSILENAGIIVLPSNAAAARFAVQIVNP